MTRFAWLWLLLVAVVGGLVAWYLRPTPTASGPSPAEALAAAHPPGPVGHDASYAWGDASFVGGMHCVECHRHEHDLWEGSHHDLAMDAADPEHVLGDFDDAVFIHHGLTHRFTREGDRFFVTTENADGDMQRFEVAYVFGVEPLQQYLVAFPDGRLQTLPLCWDTRPAGEGGQRWFHIYGGERIAPDDPLFWTGANQTWNFMCADCHSTNLKKNYDLDTDTYSTTFSEIDVSCEACHGPGSRHLDWARGWTQAHGDDARVEPGADVDTGLVVDLKNAEGSAWRFNPETQHYERTAPLSSRIQLDACGRCHSRRHELVEPHRHGAEFHDNTMLETLGEHTYHADGQIRDEVYVYGSFVQSKMHAAGVRCVDCHDPHSVQLQRPGNLTCTSCHQPQTYDTPAHHFHDPQASARGTRCVDCHMIERTYMQVDPRRDHSFRIPRPDLSVKLGTPNACSDCHDDQGFEWAAHKVRDWYGDDPTTEPPHFAFALHADHANRPDAAPRLIDVANDARHPAIARAAALRRLRDLPSPMSVEAAREALGDEEPMVRAAAVVSLSETPDRVRMRLLPGVLDDASRAVRVEAALVLADLADRLTDRHRAAYDRAEADFIEAQMAGAERASAQVNLALLHTARGRGDQAEAAYEKAIALEPDFIPGHVNLAELYRLTRGEQAAAKLLRRSLETMPESAQLRYALGLSLVRAGRTGAAIDELSRAAELAPNDFQINYVYAVALNSTGQPQRAIDRLERMLTDYPGNRQLLLAFVTMSRDAGDLDAARRYARRLVELHPNDPRLRHLARSLGVSIDAD